MNRRTEAMCHSERSEESRVHQVNVTEILRYVLDDKMIESIYFDILIQGDSVRLFLNHWSQHHFISSIVQIPTRFHAGSEKISPTP